MIHYLFLIGCFLGFATVSYGALAGGRPNAYSEGTNAFAGVVNPANAVWLVDRFDVGIFCVHQESSVNNRDNSPAYRPGKTDLTYKSKEIFTWDAAIHKQMKLKIGLESYESSLSLANYTLPGYTKLRTKKPIPSIGTTPFKRKKWTEVISSVFSFKINSSQSIGISLDYFYFSQLRNGFQNADNPLRSVSPGHVTNNGVDHSGGFGCSIGWRWKINDDFNFGVAWTNKSYCGQFRKYRGFEPQHANNYMAQTIGGGFSYRFTSKFSGRLEVIWSNFGNIPQANNSLLSNGKVNGHKHGSNKSPGPGTNDATVINMGLGYQVSEMLSLGASLSHRIKLSRKSPLIISHSYMTQTIYDTIILASNFNIQNHNLFISLSYGFKNHVSGLLPQDAGGGKIIHEKETLSCSFSYGYKY